jgi:hypothetical protein
MMSKQKHIVNRGILVRSTLGLFAILLFLASPAFGQPLEWKPVALSDSLGFEINNTQRNAYHLFPDIERFVSARFFTKNGTAFRLEYSCQTPLGTSKIISRRITATVWDLTRAHVRMVETGQLRRTQPLPATLPEPELQYRIALKFAALGRYDVSRALVSDLLTEYPASPSASEAATVQRDITRLSETRRALFLPRGLLDQSGRTDVMVFSGYYGLWAGIAIPVCLQAKEPEWYALGLIAGAPGALLLTSRLTSDADIGRGRASVIKLGGHIGTWQALGWSGLAGWDGRGVVAAGLVGGLAGITGASILTHNIYVSEGHGALMSSAMNWGAWFGFVGGTVVGADGNNLLRCALIGSDALVVTAGIAARKVQMSRGRVRLISLMGLAGTMAGFGVDILVQVDNEHAAMALAGLGGVGGLIAGARMTRNYDEGKDVALEMPDDHQERWAVAPHFSLAPDPARAGKLRPMAGLQLIF